MWLEMTAETGTFREFREAGKEVVGDVRARLKGYLDLAVKESKENPNLHRSEYVARQMAGGFSRLALDHYFSLVDNGKINAQHGYDEDPITTRVTKELVDRIGVERVVIVPTGTAANLDLIASFVTSRGGPGSLKFVACKNEHTVTLEGRMLEKAGIAKENLVLLTPRAQNDGIIAPENLETVFAGMNGDFIFQMAIPTNEGVVPSLREIKEISGMVKDHGGLFLVDGARLANALVHLSLGLGDLMGLGIDGFTLGTSKKGGLAEVVGIYDHHAAAVLHDEAQAYGHISSKSSPLSLVTGIFLNTSLWEKEATSENASARKFAQIVKTIGISPEFEVCANAVFLKLEPEVADLLAKDSAFGGVYADYGPEKNVARVIFTGFLTLESVLSTAAALVKAKQIPVGRFLEALTPEERKTVLNKGIVREE